MPAGGHRRDNIDHVHDVPAKEFSEHIGLRRQHHFRHLRRGRAHWLPFQPALFRLLLRKSGSLLHRSPRFPYSANAAPYACHRFRANFAARIIREVTMTDQKKTRRQKLEEFLAANPNDAFSRYGIALDCRSEEHTSEL